MSLFNTLDVLLPQYFELQAAVTAVKPIKGYKANGYLIFDYQSPADFKFAGVNVSTNKLEIGHRDASGWVVDVNKNVKLKPDQDYNLLLSLNGVTAVLVVDNSNSNVLSHTPSTTVAGQAVATVGFVFNAVIVDGQAGLFSRGGVSSFAGYTYKTDDSQFIEP